MKDEQLVELDRIIEQYKLQDHISSISQPELYSIVKSILQREKELNNIVDVVKNNVKITYYWDDYQYYIKLKMHIHQISKTEIAKCTKDGDIISYYINDNRFDWTSRYGNHNFETYDHVHRRILYNKAKEYGYNLPDQYTIPYQDK